MAGIDDRILSRRQRDLDRFTESMADSLDRQAGQFGQQLLPAWKRMEGQVTKKIKDLYVKMGAIQDPAKIKELKTQADRLEALHSDLVSDIKTVEAQYQPAYTAQLYNTFEKSYYMTGYGLEAAAQVTARIPILAPTQVLGVLANPWLPDGANYSARLRANTAFLGQKMRGVVAQAVAEGHSWQTVAQNIRQATGEGYFNAVRLARTEMTRAASVGSSYCYMQNADVLDGKRWNATLDSRTAPRDAANDGKIYDLDYDTPENPGVAGQRIPNHPHCRCIWSPVISALGVNQGERFKRTGDSKQTWGQGTQSMERDYDTYAQARGLPSLADMLDHDNPKSYLRPGESVADLAKTVKRWSYKGAAITIAKPLWDIVAATPPSAAAAAPVPPKPKGPTLREQLEQDIPAAIFKTVDPDVYSLYMNDLEAAPTDIQDFTRKYFKNLAIVENDTTGTSHYSAGAKAVRLDKSTLKDVRESWVTNKFTHGRHTVPHEIGHALDYSVSIEKGKGAYNYISGISDDFRTALDDMKAEYKTQHSTAVNTGWVRMVKDPKKWAAKDKAQKDAITWLDTFKKEAKKFTAFGWENGSYVNNMRYAGVSDIIDSLTDASFSMGCGHGKEYWKRPGAMQKEAFANLYQLHLHKQQDAIDWLNARYPKLIASFRAIIEGKV